MQMKQLEPILENEKAQISLLPPKSKAISDPDNSIMFLNNGRRILNPTNVRTPPPPMWGEEIEEDYFDPNEEFYNHEKAIEEQKQRPITVQSKTQSKSRTKRLKKKVVYVYETDSESDEENKNKKGDHNQAMSQRSRQQQIDSQQYIRSHNYSYAEEHKGLPKIINKEENRRQISIDKSHKNQLLDHVIPKSNLFMKNQINDIMRNKPPLPQSKGLKSSGIMSNLPQSRQIRTGAFQLLPSLVMNKKLQ